MSSQSFADLGVSKAVQTALSAQGFTAPFKIQNAVIGDALAGRDILARSPTGSGKTLAFGIPLVDRIQAEAKRPAALILAPTRELATQIVDEIRGIAHSRALRVCAVYGGVGLLKQAQEAARSHIIVATPGRLEDQLKRGAFNLKNVKMLVIDEADRMLDMGFRPAIDRIVDMCPNDRQTLFFSATLEGDAGRIAKSYTASAAFHEHGPVGRHASESVEHRFVATTHDGRLETLVSELNGNRDLAIVFVRTKHGADKLVKKLEISGVSAVAMHGNKTQRQRESALAKFESFQVDTLVATDVAARGIDVDGISHVIQFDPPHDSETYVHRVGRTGRAGATGVAVSLVSPDQRRDMARMVGELGIDMGLVQPASVGAEGYRKAQREPAARTSARPTRERSSDDRARSSDRTSRSSDRPSRSNDRPSRSNDRPSSSSRNPREGNERAASRDGYKPRGDRFEGRSEGRSDARPERRGEGHGAGRTEGRDGQRSSRSEGHPRGAKSSGSWKGSGSSSARQQSGGSSHGAKSTSGKPSSGKSYAGKPKAAGKPTGGKAVAKPGRPGNRASRAAR